MFHFEPSKWSNFKKNCWWEVVSYVITYLTFNSLKLLPKSDNSTNNEFPVKASCAKVVILFFDKSNDVSFPSLWKILPLILVMKFRWRTRIISSVKSGVTGLNIVIGLLVISFVVITCHVIKYAVGQFRNFVVGPNRQLR